MSSSDIILIGLGVAAFGVIFGIIIWTARSSPRETRTERERKAAEGGK